MAELITHVLEGTLELRARQHDDREGDGRQQDHEECIFDERLARLSPFFHGYNDGSTALRSAYPPFGPY